MLRTLFLQTLMKKLLLSTMILLFAACTHAEPAKNPDPNHTHADFAIWINNEQLDLSADKYMSGAVVENDTHEDAEDHDDTTGEEHDHEHLHDYLHLHDGVGYVVHRHKPGFGIAEFLESIGFTFLEGCLMAEVEDILVCNDEGVEWQMFVNSEEVPFDLNYTFTDLDKILITYGATSEQITTQLQQMTDDACLYSRTCPERGNPPVENCIADPDVPCVLPE